MKAQNILNKRRFKKDTPNAQHPLTGLLVCGQCGEKMVCQKRQNKGLEKVYRYYICKTYHKYGRDQCTQANINADELEEFILDSLMIKLRDLYPKLKLESKLTKKDLDTARLEKELAEIKRKLEKVNKDTADLYFERDTMTDDQYKYIAKRLKDEATRLQAQSGQLERELELKEKSNELSAGILKYIEEFYGMDKGDAKKIRTLLHYFIDEIVIKGKRIEIKYAFSD